MAECLKVTCWAQSLCLGGKVKVRLHEALKPKLFTGCVDGLKEKNRALPEGQLTWSMHNTLRRALWSGWYRWHHLGELPSKISLRGEDLNMNESPGSQPQINGYKTVCSSLVGLSLCLCGLGCCLVPGEQAREVCFVHLTLGWMQLEYGLLSFLPPILQMPFVYGMWIRSHKVRNDELPVHYRHLPVKYHQRQSVWKNLFW